MSQQDGEIDLTFRNVPPGNGDMQSLESRTLLVANRGEIAIRVMEGAAALGMRTIAIF
jgi:Biotin carboxylase, N-terminal domain